MKSVVKGVSLPLVALVSLAAMLVVSPSAAAATSNGVAITGRFDLFQNNGFSGGMRSFTSNLTEFNGQKWNNGQSMQNSASSMENHSDSFVGMWDNGTACTGANYIAQPFSVDSTFGNNNFDNRASCLKFI